MKGLEEPYYQNAREPTHYVLQRFFFLPDHKPQSPLSDYVERNVAQGKWQTYGYYMVETCNSNTLNHNGGLTLYHIRISNELFL